ncbi:MAG TPA: phage holin family protein [Gaiellaceae bacterium]|nr:phage holin family protein [Gaiellaceae bacterium]
MNATTGLSGAARRVADHARSLVKLELDLAAAEIKQKIAALGIGIGLVVTAGVLGLFGLAFGLAAATAAIATAVPVWLALLIVFGGLFILAGAFATIGVGMLRKGAPPVPKQALEEARLTTEALRNGH